MSTPDPVRILSIDGGGIRGIIPALLLDYVEQQTGKPTADLFDLIAGTSTGGMLAVGLAKPDQHGRPQFPAAALARLYEKEGSRIFSRSPWKKLLSLDNLADEKYSAKGLEEVLLEYFADARLKDVLSNVLITAYEIEQRFPFFFKSWRAKQGQPGYDFSLRDVARATSAAPTYFEPTKIPALEPPGYWALIDGGVFANNPAMCALAESHLLFPGAKSFVILSLGTGELTRKIAFDEAVNWGAAKWLQPVLDVMFSGVAATVDYQLRQVLPNLADGRPQYVRIQTQLTIGNDDMDDASQSNIHILKQVAAGLIKQYKPDLDRISEVLSAGGE